MDGVVMLWSSEVGDPLRLKLISVGRRYGRVDADEIAHHATNVLMRFHDVTAAPKGPGHFPPGQFPPGQFPPDNSPSQLGQFPPVALKTQLENYIYTYMYAHMHTYIQTC